MSAPEAMTGQAARDLKRMSRGGPALGARHTPSRTRQQAYVTGGRGARRRACSHRCGIGACRRTKSSSPSIRCRRGQSLASAGAGRASGACGRREGAEKADGGKRQSQRRSDGGTPFESGRSLGDTPGAASSKGLSLTPQAEYHPLFSVICPVDGGDTMCCSGVWDRLASLHIVCRRSHRLSQWTVCRSNLE